MKDELYLQQFLAEDALDRNAREHARARGQPFPHRWSKHMKRTVLVVGLWVAMALTSPAYAVGSNFSYQGSLQDAGVPANGSYDLEFRLQTQAGAPIGSPVLKDNVAVAQGVFSVELDFGSVISTANYQLQIGVRAGASTGAFTALTPPTKITPTPQAQVATIAAEAVTVSPSSVTSAGIADGTIGSADINSGQVQARVSSGCAIGSAITQVNANGTVSCQPLGTGDITGVTAGAGLLGGGTTGAVALSVDGSTVQSRVSGNCPIGSSIRQIDGAGAVLCQTDTVGSGDIASVTAGTGLAGGGLSGDVTIDIAAGGVTNALLADDAITTNKIAAAGVNTSDIANGAVTMAKITTPTGSAIALSANGASSVYSSPSINFTEPGTCLTIAKAVTTTNAPGTEFRMRPILLHVASNTSITPAEYAGSVLWYDGVQVGREANASAVLTVQLVGIYRFGCEMPGFASFLSCQVSWMCN